MVGRIELNLGGPSSQLAFRNWIKGSDITSGSNLDPSKMDVDGYPVSSLATALSISMLIPASFQGVAEQWVLKNTGTRTLVVNTDSRSVSVVSSSGGTVTGGSNSIMTVSGSNWRVVFTWAAAQNPRVLNFPVGSGYASGTGQLVLCRLSDEAAHDAGDAFNPEFIALYGALSLGTLRTMPPAFNGSKNVCTNAAWANRPTTSHLSYKNAYFKPSIYGGVASGTDQYTIAAAPSTNLSGWDANEMIQARVTNASNAAITVSGTANNGGKVQLTVNSSAALSPSQAVYIGRIDGTVEASGAQTILTVDDATHVTLNVNYVNAFTGGSPNVGTATLTVTGKTGGTKFILNMHGNPLNWSESVGIAANSNCTFIYDNVLDALLYNSSDGGVVAGWPVETQVALANKLGCNLWVNISPLMTPTDAQSLAALVSGSLSAGLKAYFEYGNEVWNFNFSHTDWAIQRGRKLGLVSDFDSYYACVGKMMMDAVTTGWGARTRTELRRVLGQQNVQPKQSARMNGSECVTGNASYNAFTGSRSFNASPNRFVDTCDTYAMAPYIDGANLRSGAVGGWTSREATFLQSVADNWNLGTTAGQNAAIALIDNDIRKGTTNSQTVTIGGGATFTGSQAYTNGWRVLMGNVTGLNASGLYFVVNASGNTFQTSATAGGAAITGLSSGGSMTSGRLGGGVVLTLLNQFAEYSPAHEALVASYDTQRAGIGLAPLTVECYEGFLEHIWVSGVSGSITSAICDTIGLTPTGSGAGSAYLAITAAYTAYLASNSAQQMAYDYCSQLASFSHFQNPGFFPLTGPGTWSLSSGDTTVTPYQTYEGARLYSNRMRRKSLVVSP